MVRPADQADDLPCYVTREQVGRARMHAADLAASSLIAFLWGTGARISEALALRPRDIDVENGTVKLPTLKRRRKDGSGRKVTSARVVPVAGGNLRHVLAYIVQARREAKDRVWPIDRRWAWKRISEALRAAGVEPQACRPHAIRHGHAVHAVLHGVALNLIQRQLGHASIVTTAIYLRVTGQDIREAYGRFDW